MHGYAARCGFGITLIRNHTVEEIPRAINVILDKADFPGRFLNLRKNKLILSFITDFLIKIILFLNLKEENKTKSSPGSGLLLIYFLILLFDT
jgi:hypothetical protein